MIEVFIKYNPYKLKTEVKINGEHVKDNSPFREVAEKEKRLQEWIENLPVMLREECNDRDYHVVFHGITPDFEDLQFIAENAQKDGVNITCEHIPATETEDKEPVIRQIFEDIRKGPFDELRQTDLIQSFESASSDDFPVNVIATMSAGKSTLINALLARKLMPSKQEPCTATITEIKDCNLDDFRAVVYDKDGNIIEEVPSLTYEDMQRLNDSKEVSVIGVEGKIPFVSSKDISLVLVDTPGPNNSRDEGHKAATYRMIVQSSKTLVLYILNAQQFATNDDNALLSDVANSMSVGGKQSKDRFIFVVNKLDDFKVGEDDVESTLQKVRDYLESKGIKDPNIFPASALTALYLRTTLKDIDISNDIVKATREIRDAYFKMLALNESPEMYFETYAPLTPSLRKEIEATLAQARENNDEKAEALVHTGIIPIEAAIRMYVEKYARTAKIKNIVDTFRKKLESTEAIEKIKREIVSGQERSQEIQKKIGVINKKLQSGANAKEFEREVSKINYKEKISEVVKSINREAQGEITRKRETFIGKLDKRQAESACEELARFAETLQAKIEVKLEKVISENVKESAENLLERYKQRLADLTEELNIGNVKLSPFEIMEGTINTGEDAMNLIQDLTKKERVKTGRHWVENSNKHWWNPFTWFDDSGWYVDDYEDREYIEGQELAQKFLARLQERLYENMQSAIRYADKQAEAVKEAFKKKFKELDEALQKKLNELTAYSKDQSDTERAIRESEDRLHWLEEIRSRVDAILEI